MIYNNRNQNFKIATKAIIQNLNGQILIIKKSVEENLEDACENLFDIPGGRLEYGEKLEEALEREVREETNLIITNIQLLHADSVIRPDKTQLIIITYLCCCLEGQCTLSEEHTECFWLTTEEILQSPLYPEWMKDMIRRIK